MAGLIPTATIGTRLINDPNIFPFVTKVLEKEKTGSEIPICADQEKSELYVKSSPHVETNRTEILRFSKKFNFSARYTGKYNAIFPNSATTILTPSVLESI